MTPKLSLYLREYREEQTDLKKKARGTPGLDDIEASSIEGKPIDPGVLSHTFQRIASKAGLDGVRFHDLRHTFASLMLMRGAKPKVISEAWEC